MEINSFLPLRVLLLSVSVLCCIIAFSCTLPSLRKYKKHIIKYSILIVYLWLVLCCTLIYREPKDDYCIELSPFWSYRHLIMYKEPAITPSELYLNVLLFVPCGFLLTSVFEKKQFVKTTLIGISFSVAIELIQLLTKRGLCETDDVIHNTLGCLMGYGLFQMLHVIYKRYAIR